MKTHFKSLFSMVLFLSGCATTPIFTPSPVVEATQISVITSSTATFTAASLPDDLAVAYVAKDALWVWKQGDSQLLLQQQDIYAPQISDDGQWIIFRQRFISGGNNTRPFDELWIVRTDGSELHRLLGQDDLVALTGEDASLLVYDADWIPETQTILFNIERVIEGPPGSVPLFDLYSLEITGQVNQLVKAGLGGKFSISPIGTHVALTTNSRITVLDLRNSEQRTLLDYKPLLIPSEITFIARVIWDPQGRYLMTAIPPEKWHYFDYAGEPVQVWRLFVNGQNELITEFQPSFRDLGVSVSPNLQYVLYLDESCFPKTGMLTVHDVTSTSKTSLFCVTNLPQWTPDNDHFYFQADGLWQIGSISSPAYQPLDVLNVPTAPNIHIPPQLTWINDEYFLLVLRSIDSCTLSIATLEGIATEISRTSQDKCPRDIDFSLSN